MSTARDETSATSAPVAPAYYAAPALLRSKGARDWWTVLHPPYTVWHLAYVVIGACVVGPLNATRLVATLLAFLLAVGLSAHALDELHGRPLGTQIPASHLVAAAVLAMAGAIALGVIGVITVSGYLAVFIAIGAAVAVAYNLELFGGRAHTDAIFALSWGGFPVLTAAFAQHGRLTWSAVAAAGFATLAAQAQRQLSTPARHLRRRTAAVHGEIIELNGERSALSVESLRAPLEGALRSLGYAVDLLAIALVLVRLHV